MRGCGDAAARRGEAPGVCVEAPGQRCEPSGRCGETPDPCALERASASRWHRAASAPAVGRGLPRRACLHALAALSLAAAAGPAFAFDLAGLMALLARRRSGEARFTEQRFVSGLDAPLEASGTLSFAAPDRFTRRTLAPRPETMAVDGNRLTLSRGGRSRSFALDAVPEMTALVESVRGTLTGNAALLQRYFRTALAGDARAWTLELTPLAAELAGQVRSVRIEGQGDALRRIELRLVGGDHSVMTVMPLVADAASAPPAPRAASAP